MNFVKNCALIVLLFGVEVEISWGCFSDDTPTTTPSPEQYRRENSLPPAQNYPNATTGYPNLRHWGENCGFSKYWKADGIDFSSIVGGTDALPNEFPHQVLLRLSSGYWCGGSIIHE